MTTTVKESTLAKVVAGVVGFTSGLFMLGFASVVPAQAQTKAELQAQIQDLLETINNLQAQVDGQGSSGTDSYNNCDPSIFSGDLSRGDRGQSVMALQQFLNMSADTRVAASGPGSPGQETSYYGPLTAQAVTSFQEKFSASVLAPLNLSSGTGYWGSSSRSKAQSLCASAPSDDGQQDDGQDQDDGDDDQLEGGEASLEDFDLNSGNDNDVQEGGSAEVAEFNFDVEDGDVRVSRVDLAFRRDTGYSNTGGESADDEPWEVFEEVKLLNADGDEVASADVSSESDWLNNDGDAGDGNYYEWRFNNVDQVVRSGNEAEYTVAVTTNDNVDDAGSVSWDVNTLADAVRAVDGEGINHYAPDNDATPINFNLDQKGEGEELDFSVSSDNPDSAILPVNEDSSSDDYGVLVFEVEADEGDIQIEDLPITFSTYAASSSDATTTFSDVVDDAYLEVDGTEYDYDTETLNGTTSTAANVAKSTSTLDFVFDDEIQVEEDETKTMTLFVSLKAQEGNYGEGVDVEADLNSSDVDNVSAEGADDLGTDALSGSADGNRHELLIDGVYIEPNSTSKSFVENSDSSTTDNEGNFEIKFDLTAFEGDFFVPKGATRSTSSTNSTGDGARYAIENDSGSATSAGTVSDALSSTADESSQHSTVWKIEEGQTETFTLDTTYDPANTGYFQAQLEAARYASSSAGASNGNTTEVTATPSTDYETGQLNI